MFEGQAELYYCDNDLNFIWAPSKDSKVWYSIKCMNANLVCENVVRWIAHCLSVLL